MGILFFQNGSPIGPTAGWGGWTGNNNYVLRYECRTPSAGASSVTIDLNNIWTKKGGGQGWGFKISASSTAYANARNETPDSNIGYLNYDGNIGYNCTLTATGLNLKPNTTYYLFVYVATSGAEYYQGWNCTNPSIYCSGSFTPPDSSLSSISNHVTTGEHVVIVMNNAAGLSHTATFKYGSKVLARSDSFGNALNYTCPRSWMRENCNSDRINISVEIRSSIGGTINTNFMLVCDSGMKPVLKAGAASAEPINPGTAPAGIGFLVGISKAKVEFDNSKIDMAATEGASITRKEIRWSGKADSSEPFETDVLSDNTRITIAVTDSRGRSAESTIEIKMTPYVPPSINNAGAARCNSDGQEAQTGLHYKVIGTAVFTPLDGKNSVSIYASIKATGTDYSGETELKGWQNGIWSDTWATPSVLGGSLFGDSYTVKLRIVDRVGGSSEVTARLYRQDWVMKFSKTGNAVGFGMDPTGVNDVELPEEWTITIGGVDIVKYVGDRIQQSIMKKLYQVGDYFITENKDADPNVRFGGTWARVKDRFLLGAGNNRPAGEEGGTANHSHMTAGHTLTVNELPSHDHKGIYSNENGVWNNNNYKTAGAPSGYDIGGLTSGSGAELATGNTGGGAAHDHGKTGSASHLPPYRTVYIWRKTA